MGPSLDDGIYKFTVSKSQLFGFRLSFSSTATFYLLPFTFLPSVPATPESQMTALSLLHMISAASVLILIFDWDTLTHLPQQHQPNKEEGLRSEACKTSEMENHLWQNELKQRK